MKRLTLGLLALTSCASSRPMPMYAGDRLPASEIAVVEGRIVSLPGFVGGFLPETRFNPATGEIRLDSLDVASVDGHLAGASIVEMRPGARSVEVLGELIHIEPINRIYTHRGELKFVAQPGATYRVRAVESEHAFPWAYELIDKKTNERVAHTIPELEDFTVPIPDLTGRGEWSVGSWRTDFDAEEVMLFPPGQNADEWTERICIVKWPLVWPGPRLGELAAQRAHVPTSVIDVGDMTVHGDHWTERWKTSPSATAPRAWGVAVGTKVGDFEYRWRYDRKAPLDALVQDDWARYFRSLRAPLARGASPERKTR